MGAGLWALQAHSVGYRGWAHTAQAVGETAAQRAACPPPPPPRPQFSLPGGFLTGPPLLPPCGRGLSVLRFPSAPVYAAPLRWVRVTFRVFEALNTRRGERPKTDFSFCWGRGKK